MPSIPILPNSDWNVEQLQCETADEAPRQQLAGREECFLFVLLDCDCPWRGGSRLRLVSTDEIIIGRGSQHRVARTNVGSRRRLALSLLGATVSAQHAHLVRVSNDWAIKDQGSRNGTWVNGKRTNYAELRDRDIFQVGRTFFMFRRYESLPSDLELDDIAESQSPVEHPGLLSLSPELCRDNQRLRSVAKSSLAVLILGGTGTGKELTARAVHDLAGRSGQFCAVNCGAIPTGLVESALFGHVKGAFSGAVSNSLGIIRAAHNGTLFLDEIGDLAPLAQASLLRMLQEGEVVPVGATQPTPVDVRIISATHQPLPDLVHAGRFRADLYARLTGYVHQLRPLESRFEDFGLIFGQLLRRATGNATPAVSLTSEAAWALLNHPWPLNIRELEQAIARAVAFGYEGPLEVEHFPFVLALPKRSESGLVLKNSNPDQELQQQLGELLREHNGNVAAVARALGKGPTQIQRWLKRFGLVAAFYRGQGGNS